ncbi:CoA transferase [Rubrimonas cliftonensis]|uniref:CoA-transferase family III n=1 Tax=Rubrimonas cliftonensis TaxID=89524 RepID=A0A1H4F6J0_9RHOB|nr:CoA transferase [Rubrimonas cliftonensis]SEA92418.1 CoA-transferase family III [Rubrimonas cliftonensis]
MTDPFAETIDDALGSDLTPELAVRETSEAGLASCFAAADLAVASVRAAARELAALEGARRVALDRRLALLWFGTTLRPEGWEAPSPWDALAGDYRAADGWIRLHTNAPRHRSAALRVLGAPTDRAGAAAATAEWGRVDLEEAVVAAGGAAAAMRGLDDWAASPQGRAVAAEPLIAWRETGSGARPAALHGLRVLDLTRVLAGPVATRLLAGFGADVLRIDPPWWDEPGVEPDTTLGKRRAGLDLTRREDRRVFETLLAGADALVHGYRPGALDALGYDAERRRALAPELIEVSLSAYGWTGPWAGRRGFDSLVQMSCGIADAGMRLSGSGRPVPLPVQALDHATGHLMAAALLRALRRRGATGRLFSARLSLARTAALLTAAGVRAFGDAAAPAGPADLCDGIEATGWGPARRVRFPFDVDARGPDWPHPAGLLRCDAPEWA